MLLQADHTYFKDHRGRTVLHLSAETGSLTACDLIIRLRADAVHDLDRMVSNTSFISLIQLCTTSKFNVCCVFVVQNLTVVLIIY